MQMQIISGERGSRGSAAAGNQESAMAWSMGCLSREGSKIREPIEPHTPEFMFTAVSKSIRPETTHLASHVVQQSAGQPFTKLNARLKESSPRKMQY